MIISMKKGAPQEEINKLVRSFEEMGLSVTTIYGEDYNVFGKRVVHSAPFRMRPPIVWSKCAQTSCEAEV